MSNTNDFDGSAAKDIIWITITRVEERIKILEEKEARWLETDKRMQVYAESVAQKIVLDVGGQRFVTTRTTLLSVEGTFFHAMLASGNWKPDTDGAYFVDRNPELFPIILDYLRMGKLIVRSKPDDVVEALKAELDFYQITVPELLPKSEVKSLQIPFAESAVLSVAQQQTLWKWIEKKNTTLIYSAAQHGFDTTSFHEHCDNKGKTLSIIQTTEGYIFGGYTELLWDPNSNYKHGSTWVFTLTNPVSSTPQQYFQWNATGYGILCVNNYGPVFGGCDILVANGSNKNTSFFNFPHSFTDTTGRGVETFTGNKYFKTREVEVFLIE